jgi:3',5'-cyclic AMP phosphodiesterase CpdA
MQRDIEPTLTVPGATFIGVATALGLSLHTLTKRLRDLSVIGDMRPRQLARVADVCAARPADEHRVVVMHHNPVAGEISRRFGFKRAYAPEILRRFAAAGVDLVLCGHDHQEAAHFVEHREGRVVVATAGTITTMSRGKRPTSVNVIDLSERELVVTVLAWQADAGDFRSVMTRTFRHPRLAAAPSGGV